MAIQIVVPAMGESITEGVIATWLSKVGDLVDADQPVVEVETDKITVEVRAPSAGKLVELLAKAGDTVRVGQTIAVLDPDVVLRADAGPGHPGTAVVRGASAVAGRAVFFAGPDRTTHDVWVDGHPGVVVTVGSDVVAIMRFAVLDDRVVAVDAVVDPARLRHLEVPLPPPT